MIFTFQFNFFRIRINPIQLLLTGEIARQLDSVTESSGQCTNEDVFNRCGLALQSIELPVNILREKG